MNFIKHKPANTIKIPREASYTTQNRDRGFWFLSPDRTLEPWKKVRKKTAKDAPAKTTQEHLFTSRTSAQSRQRRFKRTLNINLLVRKFINIATTLREHQCAGGEDRVSAKSKAISRKLVTGMLLPQRGGGNIPIHQHAQHRQSSGGSSTIVST